MSGKFFTDADMKALEPDAKKYLQLISKAGKPVSVSAHRVLAIHGGNVGEGVEPLVGLELSNRTGKSSVTVYKGSSTALFEQFNELNIRKEFLAFHEVSSPLAYMRETRGDLSGIRVGRINAIERPPNYRTSHGGKTHAVIKRLDGPVMRAFEEVSELGEALISQGYKAAPATSIASFMLHPDQLALLNQQGQRLPPVKAPRRRLTPKQKSLI